LVSGPVFVAGLVHARTQAGVAAELFGGREAVDVADLGGNGQGQPPSDPGRGEQQRHVGVVGAAALELAVDLGDAALEVVDQLEAGVDRAAPWLRDLKPIEQLAAGDTEQVGDRAGV
jgi:hypothetical protein